MQLLVIAAFNFYVEFVVTHRIVVDIEAAAIRDIGIMFLVVLLTAILGLLIDLDLSDYTARRILEAALYLGNVIGNREFNIV